MPDSGALRPYKRGINLGTGPARCRKALILTPSRGCPTGLKSRCPKYMANKEEKKPVTAPVEPTPEEKDKKPADAPADEPEGDEPEGEEGEGADDTDYDAELEKEKNLGKPDPKKAASAFADRKKKRDVPEGEELESDEPEGDEEEDDKPLTRKDVAAILANDRKERQESDALAMAKTLARSDKEAELIVAKWKNRSFPAGLSLADQIQEAYVITHSKKLIGERNEALRALGNKGTASKDSSSTFRDAPSSGAEPKIAPQDAAAIKASGFAYNSTTKRYEKKLKSGDTLVQDAKTKKTFLVRKAK